MPQPPFNTTLALGHSEMVSVLPLVLEAHDWKDVQASAEETNLLQKSSTASSSRALRELKRRWEALSPATWVTYLELSPEDQKALLLVATCKTYPFVHQFISEVLHEKLLVFDYQLSLTELTGFWNQKAATAPELDELSDSTRKKMLQVMLRLLVEAGLLSSTSDPQITPVFLSPRASAIIKNEGDHYLSLFLTTV